MVRGILGLEGFQEVGLCGYSFGLRSLLIYSTIACLMIQCFELKRTTWDFELSNICSLLDCYICLSGNPGRSGMSIPPNDFVILSGSGLNVGHYG